MSWEDEGNCFNTETNIYFDLYEENESIRSSVDKTCMECPVNRRCFAEGLSEERWGVWGGIYLEDGVPSQEFNKHKTKEDWQKVYFALAMDD